MKNIFNKIKEFYDNHKKIILIAIWLLFMLCVFSYLHNKSNKLEISEHNNMVLRDSLRTLTLKNGEQVSTINSYILKKNELQKYLDISKSEIKELEKKLEGNVAYVSNIKTITKYDSIYVTDTITIEKDNSICFNIDYYDDWLELNGKSRIKDSVATTTFDKIIVPVPLQVGLTDDYRIWVKSKNPYLSITSVEGAVVEGSKLNQKQKKFSLGLSVGLGAQYGLFNKKIDFGPYVGIGLGYRIW